MSVLSLFIYIYQVETSGGHGSYSSKGGRQVGQTRAGLSSSSCPVQLENSFSSKSQKKLDGSDPTRKGGVLWLTSALNVFIQFPLQLPENVVVEKGLGGGEGGVRFSTALHHRQEGQKPPLSVPTFLGPKGFYRPADSNAGTIITSY